MRLLYFLGQIILALCLISFLLGVMVFAEMGIFLLFVIAGMIILYIIDKMKEVEK